MNANIRMLCERLEHPAGCKLQECEKWVAWPFKPAEFRNRDLLGISRDRIALMFPDSHDSG